MVFINRNGVRLIATGPDHNVSFLYVNILFLRCGCLDELHTVFKTVLDSEVQVFGITPESCKRVNIAVLFLVALNVEVQVVCFYCVCARFEENLDVIPIEYLNAALFKQRHLWVLFVPVPIVTLEETKALANTPTLLFAFLFLGFGPEHPASRLLSVVGVVFCASATGIASFGHLTQSTRVFTICCRYS